MSRSYATVSTRPLFSLHTIFNTLIYIVLFSLTTGCMEDTDNSALSNASVNTSSVRTLTSGEPVTVSGIAMKGAIFNGVVTLFSLEQHDQYIQISEQPLGSTRTDRNGKYSLQVTLPHQSVGIAARVFADPYTTMICDVPAGCVNPLSKKVKFGANTALYSGFEMYAVSPKRQRNMEVHITPLSHLAYKWAAAQDAGLSQENIALAHSHIENLFNLPAHTLSKAPADLTALGTANTYSIEQIQYGLLTASFQALADTSSWKNMIELLDSAGTRLAETGTLAAVNLGVVPEVTRSDFFYAAQSIAAELAESFTSASSQPQRSVTQQNIVNADVIQSLRQLAQVYGDIANELLEESTHQEPLRITFQPSSTTVYEGESVTLNVNALGTGPIHYQWRKNGQPIPQATREHFTLTSALRQDSGTYDCIVSNTDGSIISNTALVTVKSRTGPALVWEPPAIRLDGTPLRLAELKGYRILYGLSQQQLDRKIEIPDPYTTRFDLSGLQGATYFFAIQAIDELGNESSLSGVIKVTL